MIKHKIRTKEALAIAKGAPWAALMALFHQSRQRFPLDYKLLKNGWSFYPSVVVFYPTLRCNFSCPMCLLAKIMKQKKYHQELTLAEIKRIIDQISSFRPLLYISGGEPFLRKDIGEIIKYAKKKGLICSLTSNGAILSEAKAKEVVDAGLDKISISIDGPEKIHDQIRHQGSFKKAIQAIQIIQRLKKDKKSILPVLKIVTVISGLNLPYLDKIVDLAKELGIREVNFNHMDFKKQEIYRTHLTYFRKKFEVACFPRGFIHHQPFTAQEKSLLDIDPLRLKRKIKEIERNSGSVKISFSPAVTLENIEKYYTNEFLPGSFCTSPWFSTTIFPNGDLIPCFNYEIGNLRKEKFGVLWNSEKYRFFRQILKKEKHFPGCLRCCGLEVQNSR